MTERRARTALATSAAGVILGIAIAACVATTAGRIAGGVVLVAAWLAMLVAVHAFGRTGRG